MKDLRLREVRYLPHVTRPVRDRESTEARSLDLHSGSSLFIPLAGLWVGGNDSCKVADLQLDASRLCVAPFTLFDGGIYSRSRCSSAAGSSRQNYEFQQPADMVAMGAAFAGNHTTLGRCCSWDRLVHWALKKGDRQLHAAIQQKSGRLRH